MAILIDMDMPKECGKCCFLNDKFSRNPECFIGRNPFKDIMDISRGRPYWCPLREVVLCRECKWSESDADDWQDSYICNNRTHNKLYGTKSHGFCVWGERREE